MSLSPPKEGIEQGDATPESMERGEEAQVREAYDFEVKEQDRWLPIANGWSRSILFMHSHPLNLRVFVLRRCMMMEYRIAVASPIPTRAKSLASLSTV